MKVFLFGYYGFQNTGDEAILEVIVEQLKQSSCDIEITALSYKAKETEEKYHIRAVSRNDFSKIIRAIKEADVVISGGGSVLQDVTSSRSLMYYLAIIYIAKKMGKKVMFYGNGFGPINKAINKKMSAYIINQVDAITVRDFQAKELMKSIGVNKNIIVTADVTFSMELLDKKNIDLILESEELLTDKKLIGISVRSWKDENKYKQIVAKIADYLNKMNYQIVFIPMQYPDDVKISLEIVELMETSGKVIEKPYLPKEILSIISRFDLLIGMRLHSLVFAAIALVPMVGLEYDPKINSFLKIAGQQSGGNVKDLDFIHLCTTIEGVLNNKESYSGKLQKIKESMKHKSEMNREVLMDIFKEGE
ncbi:polysaccharide pyruvyl transferase CsaB [Alkaliphilus peptidifermentans]|uniref:Polysaccharide pyruvyl transferase CsaB n=1 Tax=Alkaliphilus peptidifermentans DSM 18978 TaxID=1120976 RepID=A0A1G5GC52_9FIRM|nr:polysaccharide pyruvyl transferase CsaB [Alkaliphilus peptidifermentans]SCY48921.1 polysaccharide pyruvyl transferase CsaB [Alkaliphilus peptidifermentans DSM 18978]